MGKIWVSPSNGCWVDVWAAPRFKGQRMRLTGPIDLPHLRIGVDADDGLHSRIGSLVVGPNAYVQCYDNVNFADSVIWLTPNLRVDDVADLPCGDEIDSMRVFDRPPFAHEPGYAAYLLWSAGLRGESQDH